ncbi:MAG: response regulator [Alphaproteobacteria bacterium]
MSQPINILLVEDDDVDVQGITRAFKKLKVANPITRARDGLEALDILRSDKGRRLRPYLIILDLNMPRMNGIEFLTALRADEALKDSIVFVLTTSKADEDKIEAYRLNVAGYIVKADPAKSFLDAVQMLDHYWRVVEFP